MYVGSGRAGTRTLAEHAPVASELVRERDCHEVIVAWYSPPTYFTFQLDI